MSSLIFVSSLLNSLSEASRIMSTVFKTHFERPVGHGTGTGFFEYFSFSTLSSATLPVQMFGPHLNRMMQKIVQQQTRAHMEVAKNIPTDISDVSNFEPLLNKNSLDINIASYSSYEQKLIVYVSTYKGLKHQTYGDVVNAESMRMMIDLVLPHDWMVISKIMTSADSALIMNQEVQYLPPKSFSLADCSDAISVALAPAVLGLVKVPKTFLNCMESILKSQIQKPDPALVAAQTPEKASEALKLLNQMQTKQQEDIDRITEYGTIGLPTNGKPRYPAHGWA